MTSVGGSGLTDVGDRAAIERGDKIGTKNLRRIMRAGLNPPAIDFHGDSQCRHCRQVVATRRFQDRTHLLAVGIFDDPQDLGRLSFLFFGIGAFGQLFDLTAQKRLTKRCTEKPLHETR